MSRGNGRASWVLLFLVASGCGRTEVDLGSPTADVTADATSPRDARLDTRSDATGARDARSDTRTDTGADVTVDAPHDAGTDSFADASTPADTGPPCPPAFVRCGETCVDPANDPAHCGGCDTACGPGTLCASSTCVATCVPPLIACGESCVDPSTSDTNCGATGDCLGANAGSACPTGAPCHDGACTCPAAYPDACADACTVFAVDPKHCGSCGHDCLGGACTAGVCGPYMVSNATWTVRTIVANETVVAWGGPADIGSPAPFVEYAPVAGGPRTGVFGGDTFSPSGPLALDATALYVGATGPSVVRVANAGGTTTTLVTNSAWNVYVLGLALDGTRLVFTQGGMSGGSASSGPWAVSAVPTAGGAVSTLLAETGSVPSVAARAGTVYLADYPAGAISSLPTSGGSPTVRVSGRTSPEGVVVDDRNLYWSEPGMVLQAPIAGGAVVTLATGLPDPDQVTVTTTSVAWIDDDGAFAVPIGGGTPTSVAEATGGVWPRALATNGSMLFWSTGYYGGSEIWALVLP